MCVAAIAWQAHPRWQLVVIGNRDEFHQRPTAPLAQWDNGILAGRDLEAGGTWLGISPGRFALVTNRQVECYPRPGMASRGGLITSALLGEPSGDTAAMNPFNLITISPDAAALSSNYPRPQQRALAGGIHGLSNSSLDERWHKTMRLESGLAAWLQGQGTIEDLFSPLADRLPDPARPEAFSSSVFIVNPAYGTRCSTVIAVDRDGAGTMIERSFDPAGQPSGEVRLTFNWCG